MIEALHREHAFSDMFVAYLLDAIFGMKKTWLTNYLIPVKKDWPVFFSCLLILARRARGDSCPQISQETLAEMVGNHSFTGQLFHEPVQEVSFIHYNGGLQVHSSLLNVVLHD
jgi:hypothetical protein